MRTYQLGVIGALGIGLLAAADCSRADESAIEVVRSAVQKAVSVLENPAYQGPANFQKRISQLKHAVLPKFARREFAQRCLGVHWRHLTATQRDEFVPLFTDLLEWTYGGLLDRYPKGIQVHYGQQRLNGKYAEVDTRVSVPDGPAPLSINYRLHQENGTWLIYDIGVNNVSMVSNYRNQFNRIINRSGYDGLIDAIKRKIAQLKTPPPATDTSGE